jgi:uncharacterized protein (DUF488 family)
MPPPATRTRTVTAQSYHVVGIPAGTVGGVPLPLVSIGYERRTADELVARLQSYDVSLLVDVRLNASSRRPGMSKGKLGARVQEAGIEYRHMPEFGNPRENRSAFRAGRPEARQRYAEHLARQDDGLTRLAAEAQERVVALLCLEQRHDECHRSIVAEALLSRAPALTLVIARD